MKYLNRHEQVKKAIEDIEKAKYERVMLIGMEKGCYDLVVYADLENSDCNGLRVHQFGVNGWEISEIGVEKMLNREISLYDLIYDHEIDNHAGNCYYIDQQMGVSACEQILDMKNDPTVIVSTDEEFLEIFDLLRPGYYLFIFVDKYAEEYLFMKNFNISQLQAEEKNIKKAINKCSSDSEDLLYYYEMSLINARKAIKSAIIALHQADLKYEENIQNDMDRAITFLSREKLFLDAASRYKYGDIINFDTPFNKENEAVINRMIELYHNSYALSSQVKELQNILAKHGIAWEWSGINEFE